MLKWITPSLAVCDRTDAPECFHSDEVAMAVDWVQAGGTAYVDSDATAKLVLLGLGLTEVEADDRVLFANTGEVTVA